MMRIQKTVLMRTNMTLMILSLMMRSWYVVLGSKFYKQILRTGVNFEMFAYDEVYIIVFPSGAFIGLFVEPFVFTSSIIERF
jgi:hypothetical protein